MKLKEPIHFMPMDDIIEHVENPECPCIPHIVNEEEVRAELSDRYVWVHNLVRKPKQEMN